MSDLRVRFPRPCDERWEAMTPAGRARMCVRCDKAVFDLSRYDLDEAEALLRAKPGLCVRACVDADGAVALKPGRQDGRRRMIVAAAVTAGLLATAGPALAREDHRPGSLAGRVDGGSWGGTVVATDREGRTFRARMRANGRYRIGRLPAGTYMLTFDTGCGGRWTVENVVIGDGESVVRDSESPNVCITVGLVEIEDGRG